MGGLKSETLKKIIAGYADLAIKSNVGCGGTNVATIDIMDQLITMQKENKEIIDKIHEKNGRGYVKTLIMVSDGEQGKDIWKDTSLKLGNDTSKYYTGKWVNATSQQCVDDVTLGDKCSISGDEWSAMNQNLYKGVNR